MAYYHGARAEKKDKTASAPTVADSSIHFIVGTAPVHTVGGKTNEVVLAYTYDEAVKALGYSDDWKKYDICEEIHTAFELYGIAPVAFVNVLDPAVHLAGPETADMSLAAGFLELPFETVADSVEVRGYDTGDALTEPYTRGVDYELIYSSGVLRLERIEGGAITGETEKLQIVYNAVDPSKVTKTDIIGGYDPATSKSKGFELIDDVFPKYRIVPALLLAPNFSGDGEVAAVMTAKAVNINNLFKAKAIIDINTAEARTYQEAARWKNENGITLSAQLAGWPMFTFEGKTYHHSTHLAGVIAKTDAAEELGGGSPCESASNKTIRVDGMVLADGTEVLLDLTKANYLNSNGIITGLNLIGGFVSWGNETACYPASTDVTDYIYCVSRMFGWIANSVILSTWNKVDRSLKRRLIDSIVQALNIWLNGLTAEEKILGGHIEFTEDENSDIDLMAGKARFHIYVTPPTPAKELEFVFEYDASYIQNLF